MFFIFISEKFIWNDIDSSELGLMLITTESSVLNAYGIDYTKSLESEHSFNGMFYKENVINQPDEINLKFCLVNDDGEPRIWDDYTTRNILNSIVTNTFKPFISYDDLNRVYYLKATKISKFFNQDKEGYIDIVFQPYSQYSYVRCINKVSVCGETEIKIINPSNVDECYYPIIELENLGMMDSINSIQNTTIGSDILEITNINTNEIVIIDNLLHTSINSNGENKFRCQNRKWIKLKRGLNTLKVIGNCNVIFKSEFPMIG